jgi:cyclic pyranopterin phosphate synthase
LPCLSLPPCWLQTMANIFWSLQDSVRLKVTDRCPWNCRWCHNEGTGARQPAIFGDICWNEETKNALRMLAQVLPIREVHLTGGEPTSHPDLPSLIAGLTQAGFVVKATSIGCSEGLMRSLIVSGLEGVNFSVHSVEPELLLQTQTGRTSLWCEHQLAQLMRCISVANELGIRVKLNTVVSGLTDLPRVEGVLDWARSERIPLRLLNDLGTRTESLGAIRQIIGRSKATWSRTQLVRGSSSYASYFRLPGGYEFGIKRIRSHYLSDSMCSQCKVRAQGRCSEGFYGLRLEKRKAATGWQLEVRLCVHRSDMDTVMTIPEFIHSQQLAEIQSQLTV